MGVTWLGLAVNVALATSKLLAGVLLRSQAIFADGLHSGSDLVSDALVLAGLRAARKPPDPCHPYGHRRLETLVAMAVGILLLLAAGWIAYEAIDTLHGLTHQQASQVRAGIPLLLAAISVPLKELLFRLTRRVGMRTGNVALRANAWHHRTDAFTSVAAAAGLAAVYFGGPRWAFLDPATALVLSAFLLIVALRIIRSNADELVDRAPPPDVLAEIERAVSFTRGVRSYHGFRARQLAGRVEMDIHVQVDPHLSVQQGHDIAGAVKRHILDHIPDVVEVIVHIEPDESNQGG